MYIYVYLYMYMYAYNIIYCKIYLQTYRHDMTYSVLKVPLNPNQPTNIIQQVVCIDVLLVLQVWLAVRDDLWPFH